MISGGLLLLFIFEAVARLPLGDCTAIFFSAPAFTMVQKFTSPFSEPFELHIHNIRCFYLPYII